MSLFCPLQSDGMARCDEEECAWYNQHHQQCVIHMIAYWLQQIATAPALNKERE